MIQYLFDSLEFMKRGFLQCCCPLRYRLHRFRRKQYFLLFGYQSVDVQNQNWIFLVPVLTRRIIRMRNSFFFYLPHISFSPSLSQFFSRYILIQKSWGLFRGIHNNADIIFRTHSMTYVNTRPMFLKVSSELLHSPFSVGQTFLSK